MKKLCFTVLGVFASFTYAATTDNSNFQQFENQYNLGYELSQMTLINGVQQVAPVNQQAINLEVEHLFSMGIWLDANLNMVTSYSQPVLGPSYLNGGSGGQGTGQPGDQAYAFGQNPFMYSATMKGGYAFSFADNKLQVTPYVMFGRNANWSSSTIVADGYKPSGTNYFLTGGLGTRVAYLLSDSFMLYADELVSYNWDNSGAIKDIQTQQPPVGYGKSYAATNYQFTTTVGAKYNVTQDFQVGLSGFWNNYQHQSNISGVAYIPQNTFGEMVTIGLTY